MWNKPGGFSAFAGGWVPEDDWDNTRRDWYTDAKKAQGKIAFSEPYVDSETGDVIITLSMTVFDGEGKDIGVSADDVAVNVMKEMINSMRGFPGQEMYIINADGLFITHEDIKAVMEKDFFKELNLEKYRASVLGSPEFFKIDDKIFIYSSAIPHTGWILVSTIPSSVIFNDINTLILRLIILCLVMLAVVVFILVFFVARKISSPIKAIHSALEKLTDEFINTSREAVNGMNEILKGVNQISVSVSHVNDMGLENNRNFDALKKETEKFNDSSGDEKQKILIVDDDGIHLEMVQAVLRDKYDVSTAKSAKEALGLFYQGLVPQLILLDLIMPDMDGWSTYDRIKAISGLYEIPIAFFTSSNDPKDIKRAREMGAVDYIKKPFNNNDLLRRIEKIL
jgi:CheY-like chemotaxis protein